MVFPLSKSLIRTAAAVGLALFAEAAALACSCAIGATDYAARQIATEAAIVAEFEVVEEADFKQGRGELLRPIRTYIGKPQKTYRLKYSHLDLCGSSFGPGKVAILYPADAKRYDSSGYPLQPDLAHEIGEALNADNPRRRLRSIRSAVVARRLDAPAALYEDSGNCLQIGFAQPGALEILLTEAERVGRTVRR